jgi:nucleotide-binding universal stress UspA family protein
MDMPYARIACCIDNDGMAETVLREGIRLAGGALGALSVVHVIAPPHALIAGSYGYIPPLIEPRNEAEAWLEEMTRGIPEAATVLLEGFPAREVCAWAGSAGVDVIVAAARRGFVERAMLGGFASHLAYHAPCSVLLVHPPAERPATAGAAEGAAGT